MPALGTSSSRWSSILRSYVLAPVLLLGVLACPSDSTVTVEVAVDPATVTVAPGESVQLHATVTGSSDTGLQWKVTSGGGTVDDSGLYTAPAEEGSAQVRATSTVSPESFAHVQVTIKQGPPVLSLALLPASRKLGVQETARFEVEISQGTGDEQLEWRVEEGIQGGTVADAGNGAARYQAPATPGTYHLVASVKGRPEVSARATLTVTPQSPQPTLRGTVTYTGSRKGRVYVVFAWGYGTGETLQPKASTSLEAPGAYSLHPIQGNSLPSYVLAFIDTLGTGRLSVVSDPMALVPIHLTGEDQVLDLTLAVPSQPPAVKEISPPQVVGMNDGLLITFGSSYDAVGTSGELADSYDIYWSHEPNPGPGNFVGKRTVTPAQALIEYGHAIAVSGLPAGQYYVGVVPVQGGVEPLPRVEGGVSATFSPVEVGRAPGAGATLSGQVRLEAPSASGQVFVVATRGATTLVTRVPMSASTVSWSIPGLADGEYTVWALLDANGDNILERATPRVATRAHVTVSGTDPVTAPEFSFVGIPATVRATAMHQNGWIMPGAVQFAGRRCGCPTTKETSVWHPRPSRCSDRRSFRAQGLAWVSSHWETSWSDSCSECCRQNS